MANLHRGEVAASFDDVPHTLVLTLGALAELEAAFGAADMLALAERFQSGRISALDATRVIAAGLRGGGQSVSEADVARMRTDGGAAGFVAIVAQLLAATFGGPAATFAVDTAEGRSLLSAREPRASAVETPQPFPGPR